MNFDNPFNNKPKTAVAVEEKVLEKSAGGNLEKLVTNFEIDKIIDAAVGQICGDVETPSDLEYREAIRMDLAAITAKLKVMAENPDAFAEMTGKGKEAADFDMFLQTKDALDALQLQVEDFVLNAKAENRSTFKELKKEQESLGKESDYSDKGEYAKSLKAFNEKLNGEEVDGKVKTAIELEMWFEQTKAELVGKLKEADPRLAALFELKPALFEKSLKQFAAENKIDDLSYSYRGNEIKKDYQGRNIIKEFAEKILKPEQKTGLMKKVCTFGVEAAGAMAFVALLSSKVYGMAPHAEMGADNHHDVSGEKSDEYLKHIQESLKQIEVKTSEAENLEDLMTLYSQSKQILGEKFYSDKMSANKMIENGQINKAHQTEAKQILSEAYKSIEKAEDNIYKNLINKYPELEKLSHGGHEDLLKMAHHRSLNVIVGIETYLKSTDNTSNAKVESFTPELKEFFLKYMTLGGYEKGRVGSMRPTEKVLDNIYNDFLKVHPDKYDLSKFEEFKKHILEKVGPKSIIGLEKNFPGYQPHGGNVELAMFDAIQELVKKISQETGIEIPEIMKMLDLPGVESHSGGGEVKIDNLEKVANVDPESHNIHLSANFEAIKTFFAQNSGNIDFDKVIDGLKKSADVSGLGNSYDNLSDFFGDQSIKINLPDRGTSGFDGHLGDILKDSKSFENFLFTSGIKIGETVGVNVGGKTYELVANDTSTPAGDAIQVALKGVDGSKVIFDAFHSAKDIGENKTEDFATMKFETIGGEYSVYSQANCTYDHEGNIVTNGNFNVAIKAGDNAVVIKGVDINCTNFLDYNEKMPSESTIKLDTGEKIKLGDIFEKEGNNVLKVYQNFTRHISPDSKIVVVGEVGNKYQFSADYNPSVGINEAKVVDTKTGVSAGVTGLTMDTVKDKAQGHLEASSFNVAIPKVGVEFVFGKSSMSINSEGTNTDIHCSANGKNVFTVHVPVGYDQVVNASPSASGPAGELAGIVKNLSDKLPNIFEEGLDKGIFETGAENKITDVITSNFDKLISALPEGTEITINSSTILSAVKGQTEIARGLNQLGEGMERDGSGEIKLSSSDLKELRSFTERALDLEKMNGEEKKLAEDSLMRDAINFTSLHTNGQSANTFFSEILSHLTKIDADRLKTAEKGLTVELDKNFSGGVYSNVMGIKYAEMNDHQKLVLGAAYEKLGVNPFGGLGNSEVLASSSFLKLDIGGIQNLKLTDSFDLNVGGQYSARISLSELGFTGNGAGGGEFTGFKSIIPLGDMGGKVLSSGFLYAEGVKNVNGNLEIKLGVTLRPTLELGEGHDIVTPKAALDINAGVKTEIIKGKIELSGKFIADASKIGQTAYGEIGMKAVDPFFGGELGVNVSAFAHDYPKLFGKTTGVEVGYKMPIDANKTIEVKTDLKTLYVQGKITL